MTITTQLCLYPSVKKKKKNIQPNQVPTAIPPLVIALSELDKTEQEVVLEKTKPAKASEKTPQTNEVESKHDATSHKDTALMEMDDMSRKTEDIKYRILQKSPSKQKSTTKKRKQ